MEAFNIFDLFIIGVIIASMIMGLLRGFVKEALSVAAWIISTWVSISFGDEMTAMLSSMSDSRTLVLVAAYGSLFFGTLIVTSIINFLIANIVTMSGFTFTDKILGLLFGFLRGAIFIAIIGVVADLTSLDATPWWQSSEYIAYFRPMIDWLTQFIPENTDIIKNIQMPDIKVPDLTGI